MFPNPTLHTTHTLGTINPAGMLTIERDSECPFATFRPVILAPSPGFSLFNWFYAIAMRAPFVPV
ncbi:MAG: hypothetical protein CFH05_00400 [Alphaproteobacteria bacterium MarineAlpha3_Bin4]|nr:MAG: hypothetical protein CFH05_00400 [Alphaproteobacteria bacterium MarineAlpha3_Bin4]